MGKFFFAALMLWGLCSCRAVHSLFITDNVKRWHVLESWNDTTDRRVIIFGVSHLGKQNYWDDVKQRLDSLRTEGYMIYMEGVAYQKDIDSLTLDTVCRKMRKVLGFHLTNYLDQENKSRKPYNTKKYVHQDYKFLGIHPDSIDCIYADLYATDLINRYEERNGEIILTDYDWNTPLMEKYRWRKAKDGKSYSTWELVSTIRNRHVVDLIKKSEDDKIVVLYGINHVYHIYPILVDELGLKSQQTRDWEARTAAKEQKKAAGKKKKEQNHQ